MTINKFQGKTQEEAIAKAKEEFGERAVIMNIREVKPKGLFRAFKNSTFEVTAAMEEKEHFSFFCHTLCHLCCLHGIGKKIGRAHV